MSVEAKQAKQVIIDEIKAKLDGAQSAVVIDYMGTTVEESTAMRKALREAGVDYSVYKNTLIAKAIEGTKFEGLKEFFIDEFKKMEFKAGVVEGNFFDQNGIKEIASIPSRDVLIAKFMGSIQSPVSKAVRTFQAIADAKAEA